MTRSSRLPGFYKLSIDARRRELGKQCGIDPERLARPLLDEETANHMVENVVAVYGLPLGVALNFQINGRDLLVPMCVEEPSVIEVRTVAPIAGSPPDGAPGRVADDFAALLAFERGEKAVPPMIEPIIHAVTPDITPEMLDQIATTVAEG